MSMTWNTGRDEIMTTTKQAFRISRAFGTIFAAFEGVET